MLICKITEGQKSIIKRGIYGFEVRTKEELKPFFFSYHSVVEIIMKAIGRQKSIKKIVYKDMKHQEKRNLNL